MVKAVWYGASAFPLLSKVEVLEPDTPSSTSDKFPYIACWLDLDSDGVSYQGQSAPRHHQYFPLPATGLGNWYYDDGTQLKDCRLYLVCLHEAGRGWYTIDQLKPRRM